MAELTPPIMPLSRALYLLSQVHTRDDDLIGFIVILGAGPEFFEPTRAEYIEAWRSVRHAIGQSIDPPPIKPMREAVASREQPLGPKPRGKAGAAADGETAQPISKKRGRPSTGFDKKAYQRELMRKRRAEKKGQA